MRELIYIPIIHNPWVEYGLTKEEREDFKKKIGIKYEEDEAIFDKYKDNFLKNLNEYWDGVELFIKRYKINKIYQDSFVLPKHPQKYSDVIKRQIQYYNSVKDSSRNYKCIIDLIREQDSTPILTESYYLHENQIKDLKNFSNISSLEKSLEYITKRDIFISERISHSLKENEIGVLFIGLGHNTDQELKEVYNLHLKKFHDNDHNLLNMLNIQSRVQNEYNLKYPEYTPLKLNLEHKLIL